MGDLEAIESNVERLREGREWYEEREEERIWRTALGAGAAIGGIGRCSASLNRREVIMWGTAVRSGCDGGSVYEDDGSTFRSSERGISIEADEGAGK